MKKIGLAGAGTMGASIARCFAKHGYVVWVYDIMEEALKRAKELIELDQPKEVAARISYSGSMRDCFADADFILESVKEDLSVKHTFWAEASAVAPENCLLATNTSGLSITAIAEAVKKPDRFGGMHWFNPAHLIPLVEVIKGDKTSAETGQKIYDLAVAVKKKPIMVEKDAPGFVGNRIQAAVLRECNHIAGSGIASYEDIDKAVKYALGFRYACLGPFEVADMGGLDIFHYIFEYLFPDLSDAKQPFGLLEERFKNGEYGVKTGKGVYDYSGDKAQKAVRRRDELYEIVANALHSE